MFSNIAAKGKQLPLIFEQRKVVRERAFEYILTDEGSHSAIFDQSDIQGGLVGLSYFDVLPFFVEKLLNVLGLLVDQMIKWIEGIQID